MNFGTPTPLPADNPAQPVTSEHDLRAAIGAACQAIRSEQLDPLGLLSLSHRSPRSGAEGMLTLSGTTASPRQADNLQWLALQTMGGAYPGADGPGRWLALHRALLTELPRVDCILMLAPNYATALACMPAIQQDGLPAFHPALASFGGDDLACAGFVPSGAMADADQADSAPASGETQAVNFIAENVLAALGGRQACLLANQGMLVTGRSLGQAMDHARRLEALARTYCTALQIGEPALLDAGKMHDGRVHWQASD